MPLRPSAVQDRDALYTAYGASVGQVLTHMVGLRDRSGTPRPPRRCIGHHLPIPDRDQAGNHQLEGIVSSALLLLLKHPLPRGAIMDRSRRTPRHTIALQDWLRSDHGPSRVHGATRRTTGRHSESTSRSPRPSASAAMASALLFCQHPQLLPCPRSPRPVAARTGGGCTAPREPNAAAAAPHAAHLGRPPGGAQQQVRALAMLHLSQGSRPEGQGGPCPVLSVAARCCARSRLSLCWARMCCERISWQRGRYRPAGKSAGGSLACPWLLITDCASPA